MEFTPQYKRGDRYRQFTFTEGAPIEELQSILYEARHEPTGAKVMHISCGDPENLFCLSFQTLPSDSTGAPHVLEHTLLCGSKKFPVKDPFFSMYRRSLHTFMNAMTGPDFTCYPAASQVEKDFYNLLEIYLDAAFFPELKPFSFLQEGHRLEFENPEDPNSPLIYRGIVFNEMKGSLSYPEARLSQEMMRALMPDLPYAFNFGGDPKEIPNLTHKALKNFHATFYHPSRCLFFFYGNLPTEKHLDFIEKSVLHGVEKMPELPKIPRQKRFDAPRTYRHFYPLGEREGKTYCAFGWLTLPIENHRDLLALATLDLILMETDASPLKFALMQSGLCKEASSEFPLDMRELPYIITCCGSEEKNLEQLQQVIFNTLRDIAHRSITPQAIRAAIHRFAFHHSEITSPFGLTLFFRSGVPKQYGCQPKDMLALHETLQEIQKEALADSRFFPTLIERYFLHNPHFVALTMAPDPNLERIEREEESRRLRDIEQTLDESARKEILAQAKRLEELQEKTEEASLECLPKLTLADIPGEVTDFPLNREQKDALEIFHHPCFTNQIAYIDLSFALPACRKSDLSHLQLLTSLLPELGAGPRDYRANLEFIQSHLGGFDTALQLHPQVGDPTHLTPSFRLKGKVMSPHMDKLFDLFKDVCRSPHLRDAARIRELILQMHTSLENHLVENAMAYATQLALSQCNPSRYVAQHWHGLSYFLFLRDLAHNIDDRLPQLIEKFEELQSDLSHFNAPTLILSCDEKQYHALSRERFYDLGALPSKPPSPWVNPTISPATPLRQGYSIASPVAFSALAFTTEGKMGPTSPLLNLSSYLIKNAFLHKEIRERGGAYGSGARHNPVTGDYHLYAYRDPHITRTYRIFREGIDRVASGKFTEKDLEEAKFSALQNLDAPTPPGQRAITSYSLFRMGKTKAMRRVFRERTRNAEKKEVKAAVEESLAKQKEGGIAITFASENLLKGAPEFERIPI